MYFKNIFEAVTCRCRLILTFLYFSVPGIASLTFHLPGKTTWLYDLMFCLRWPEGDFYVMSSCTCYWLNSIFKSYYSYLHNALYKLTGENPVCEPSMKTCFHLSQNTVCPQHMAVIPPSPNDECKHLMSSKWQLVVSRPFVLQPCDAICSVCIIWMKSFVFAIISLSDTFPSIFISQV